MFSVLKKYFVFLFLCLFLDSSVEAAPSSLFFGYIEKVYPLTQEVVVSITNKELLHEFPYVNQWQLFVGNKAKKGVLVVYKQESQNKKILLYGHIVNAQENIYAGLSIGLRLLDKKKLDLPDSFQVQPFLKNVIVNVIDKSEMVLIPAGPFLYGTQITNTVHYTSGVTQNDTSSPDKVLYQELPDFYIDRYEITNNQFEKFLHQSGSALPPHFVFGKDPDKPVTNVSYSLASRYCRWANKRLPTELEWEKTARGGVKKYLNLNEQNEFLPADRIYSMGSEFNANVCNTLESKRGETMNVHSLHDESPYRVFGMCGNALEWTSSWLLPYRGNTVQNENFGRKYKVIKGGSFEHKREWAKTYSRMAGGIPSLQEDYRAGFRCAKNIE